MNLGENIYKFRTQKNMSQGDLAEALDVSRQSVSKWENNNAVPELDKLMNMAELFGITLDELVGKQPSVPPVDPPHHGTVQSNITTRKIIGIILVCTGALFLLMSLSATHASVVASQSLFGGLFLICGAIYLNVKQHPGLFCLYVLYLISWLPVGVLAANYIRITFAQLIQIAHMGFGGGLMLYSWKKDIHASTLTRRTYTIVYYSILAATVMISFLFLLFPGLLPTPGLMRF